jgi:hypothetical protein
MRLASGPRLLRRSLGRKDRAGAVRGHFCLAIPPNSCYRSLRQGKYKTPKQMTYRSHMVFSDHGKQRSFYARAFVLFGPVSDRIIPVFQFSKSRIVRAGLFRNNKAGGASLSSRGTHRRMLSLPWVRSAAGRSRSYGDVVDIEADVALCVANTDDAEYEHDFLLRVR